MKVFHGRVEPVLLAQLNGQAFLEVARHDAGRIEGLQHAERLLDQFGRRAERFSNLLDLAGQVAGFIDQPDQVRADHPHGRVGHGQLQLFGQVIRQGGFAGKRGIEGHVAIKAAAAATA
jgi:hypothetical protein